MEAGYSDRYVSFDGSTVSWEKMEISSREVLDQLRQAALLAIQSFSEIIQTIDSYIEKGGGDGAETAFLKSAAKRIFDARSRRVEILPSSMLGEPAWDMMLALYAADKPLITKALCIASSAPETTAFRWLLYLDQAGYIRRTSDARDGRRVMVSLSKKGEAVMCDVIRRMVGPLNMDVLNVPTILGHQR